MTNTNTAQMVADLQTNDQAIQAQGWIAPGLGRPNSALGFLNSGLNPLSGLAASGLAWFIPMVSFLGEGLTQLQGGDSGSVSSGSQDFGTAGSNLGTLADDYRTSTTAQTSGWTGQAADDYRTAAAQHADGVAGLGGASNSTASAIVGAGQVVAQCIAEVTELIGEAVTQIVPIMTQAVARAGETNGESIAEAIPPCIAIAVKYAMQIASKLAALMASGDNLMKLVQGGMAIVSLIQSAMTSISNQSMQPDAQAQTLSAGQGQGGGAPKASDTPQAAEDLAQWDQGNSGNSAPASSGGSGGGGAMSNVSPTPSANQDTSVDPGTHASGATPSPISSIPNSISPSQSVSHTGGGSSYHSGGGLGMGSSGLGGGLGGRSAAEGARTAAPGSRTGVGVGGESQQRKQQQQSSTRSGAKNSGTTTGGMPMGAMGGARAAGDQDKEHQRKYGLDDPKLFEPTTPDIESPTIEAS